VNTKYSALLLVVSTLISGCTSSMLSTGTAVPSGAPSHASVNGSYLELERDGALEPNASQADRGDSGQSLGGGADGDVMPSKQLAVRNLKPIPWPSAALREVSSIDDMFSDEVTVAVSANKMPLPDFIHYVFGDLLAINYVLDQTVASSEAADQDAVTLSVVNQISQRDLYTLVGELFLKRGIQLKYGDGTFYIYRPEAGATEAKVVVAVGGQPSDVPNTTQLILQVVPLKFGIKVSIERALISSLNVRIQPDYEQGVLEIRGKRASILRALELIELLDTPATRGKHIAIIGLTFVTPEVFGQEVSVLLANEGIATAVGLPGNSNVVVVPLAQKGAAAIFASSDLLLERVKYWATIIDVPGEGSNEQYFLYNPLYARALDLGESVSALLGVSGGLSGGQNSRGTNSGATTGNAPTSARTAGLSTEKIKMVVDERANALVFYTSASEYSALMPLLSKLDILPKQVSLDITIAEVTLQDEFKFGVEWALSRSEVTLTTQGAFGASAVGGLGLIVDGLEGPLTANFLNTNSLVKVLSNPTVMVRDGVTASINVGSDISVVGATTQDPINGERQTTTSEYRKTGVDVTVTPTVNAQGIVVMEISMTISNSVPSSTGASGNPDIFERLIDTEVVAESGQTIMIGGLISESASAGGSGAPGLASIPLLGNLFRSKSDSNDRTELVMLITPRVMDAADQWDTVKEDFQRGLKFLQLK
jgi:general secretion pathway protein D